AEMQPLPPALSDSPSPGLMETDARIQSSVKQIDIDEETAASDTMSPINAEGEEERKPPTSTNNYLSSPSMGHDFSNIRLIFSSPSSFLRAGSRFHGTQQSERLVFDIQVEIKQVNMRESFLCGYFCMQGIQLRPNILVGLTEDHINLTTYIEGEIIGTKYSFLTRHQDWGASKKVDLQHWAEFSAFRPFQKSAGKDNLYIPNLTQQENIFMRWKEHFLVPNHRVRTISCASFEGFYYICFNQVRGTISGLYFHEQCENFQRLELKHIEDRGCFSAIEFR
ncbi:vacuolar import and degradation protein-domain-containing protein, partial [Leptodontidium sp. MPI-SDFR-AT-0119]